MRIPLSAVPRVDHVLKDLRRDRLAAQVAAQPVLVDPPKRSIGEFGVRVPAGPLGFDDGQIEDQCDLNELLIRDSTKTYLYTVSGDSMDRAGIFDGDRVVVDRSLEARNGDIIVAVLPGEGHTLKRLQIDAETAALVPESSNAKYRPRRLRADEEWLAWGVVTAVIRQYRRSASRTGMVGKSSV